jgi:hypothetical protein
MKKFLVAALLVACNVQAQTPLDFVVPGVAVARFIVDIREQDKLEDTPPVKVVASGFGDTCAQALVNAKKNALEKVNGVWVSSIERANNGKYSEEVVQYSGGVIKSFKYLRDDCTYIILEAEVMKRSNRVQMEKADLSRQQVIHIDGIKDQVDRKKQAADSSNDRSSAVYFKPKNTQLQLHENGKDILVSIEGTFAFTDKWRADYLALREQFGYFNLPSFEPEARIVITAFDSSKTKVFQTSFVHTGDWVMWGRRTYGASPTMEVYTNKSEDATVKFVIPRAKISDVKSFEVKVL